MPRFFILGFLSVLGVGGSAAAHPHVFIDAEVGFALTDGQLAALRVSWTYDEFTTLVLFDVLDLDGDGDGILSEADLAKAAAGETDWPDDYDGDVYLELGGASVPLARPENPSAEMQGDRLTVRFDLPLRDAMDLSGQTAVLRVYDPFYYYAYDVIGITDLASDLGACDAVVIPFEPDAATSALQDKLAALSREETPDEPDVGRLFADEVVLTCD